MPDLQYDPAQTAALDTYFAANAPANNTLICATGTQCRASHSGGFCAAQVHHVGHHYDLICDSKPLRIVVVGQEYGHGPEFVTPTQRRDIIVGESGTRRRFKADGDFKARNPHCAAAPAYCA